MSKLSGSTNQSLLKHRVIALAFGLLSLPMIGQEIYSIRVAETQEGSFRHEIILSFGNCGEVDSADYALINDTVAIDVYYHVGVLTVPCTDTARLVIHDIIDSCTYPMTVSTLSAASLEVYDQVDTLVDVCTTGLNNEPSAKAVNAFPNPSADAFTISGTGIDFSRAEFQVYDIQGRPIPFSTVMEANQLLIKLHAPAGIYYLQLLDQGLLSYLTLIKSN